MLESKYYNYCFKSKIKYINGVWSDIMENTMGTKLANISIDMNVIKKLCKDNEYKGQQIIYKKQPKIIIEELNDNAIINFVYDTYVDEFTGNRENLIKLIKNSKIDEIFISFCF